MTAAAPGRRPAALAALVVGLLALGVRLALHARSFDTFVDEFFYEQLGHSVHAGGFPRDAVPQVFFLHPPAFFYVEGLWEDIVGRGSGAVAAVLGARVLNALFGAATCAVATLLVARRDLRWAAATGLVLAVEPFVLRQNGRVLLETSMTMWALAGLLVVVPLADRATTSRGGGRAVAGGLLLGVSVLTKDTAVLITVLPVLAAARVLPRDRRSWVVPTLLASAVPYAVWLVAVAVGGELGPWWSAKLSGLSRASGAQVTTGFGSGEGGSLVEAIREKLLDFGGTYLMLAVGLAALLLLLRWGRPADRLVAVAHAGAVVTIGYSLAFGTVEEQFLYPAVVAGLVCCGLAGALLSERARTAEVPARAPEPARARVAS